MISIACTNICFTSQKFVTKSFIDITKLVNVYCIGDIGKIYVACENGQGQSGPCPLDVRKLNDQP